MQPEVKGLFQEWVGEVLGPAMCHIMVSSDPSHSGESGILPSLPAEHRKQSHCSGHKVQRLLFAQPVRSHSLFSAPPGGRGGAGRGLLALPCIRNRTLNTNRTFSPCFPAAYTYLKLLVRHGKTGDMSWLTGKGS
ncbi:unnamed protein product [Lepidochelys kempii]